MMYKTHVMTGLAVGAGIAVHSQESITFTATYVVGITLGSLLPDVDQPTSFIGQRSLGIAKIVSKLFGHRGFTHSLICWLLVSSVCLYVKSNFFIGISIGYLVHILADFFSKSSVPLLKPFSDYRPRLKWFSYKNGGKAESVIKKLAFIICLYFVLIHQLYESFFQSLFDSIIGYLVNALV